VGAAAGAVLRVAALVDGELLSGWVRSVLEFLDAQPAIHWVFAVVAPVPQQARPRFAVRAYDAFDRRRYRSGADAYERGDASSLLARTSLVHHVELGGESNLSRETVDVLLDLRLARGAVPPLLSAREWWWLELADAGGKRLDPTLWSAVASALPVCQATVVVQDGQSRSEVSSVVALNPASVTLSRSLVYRRAATLFVRELQARVRGHVSHDARSAVSQKRTTSVARLDVRSPSVVRFAVQRVKAAARARLDNVRGAREQWIVGTRPRSMQRSFADPRGYIPTLPPTDRTYADPFVVDHAQGTLVFLEELLFATRKGTIAVAELQADGKLSEPRTVLERSYHLSFPFVFREGADWFMIPETASNSTVELYRAEDFPDRWVLERVMLQGLRARDTTVLHARGSYWLFTTIEGSDSRHDELHLFRSDELAGPWAPHPRNPVVSDVRCARSAGGVFEQEGHLIRPAQDCSERYGGALVFRRIVLLDEQQFREETVARVPATWTHGLHGAHTYNRSQSVEVIDGARIAARAGRSTSTGLTSR
jgi:hypothetical protein